MREKIQQMTEGNIEYQNGYLEFSCQRIEISVKPGEVFEGTFIIYAVGEQAAEGFIMSSDNRMTSVAESFQGYEIEIAYRFDATGLEHGRSIEGDFYLISNLGECYMPFQIKVEQEHLSSSIGDIKDLFLFTNLAKSNWNEAVSIFYSEGFQQIFEKNEKQYLTTYHGFSKIPDNESNMEEFLLAVNKKVPIQYQIEEKEIRIEIHEEDRLSPHPVEQEFQVTIDRSGWGYTNLDIMIKGSFLHTEKEHLSSEDFSENVCKLRFFAELPQQGSISEYGKIIFCNSHVHEEIPVILEQDRKKDRAGRLHTEERRCMIELMSAYEQLKLKHYTHEKWMRLSREIVNKLLDVNEDNIDHLLIHVQLLLTEQRFNEAKWYLDQIAKRLEKEQVSEVTRCYNLYLTTLYNRDEQYMQTVMEQVKQAYEENPGEWKLAWLLLFLDENLEHDPDKKWHFMEEQFHRGCSSPVLYLEALQMILEQPYRLQKLDDFEECILWYAARHQVMPSELVDQMHYLVAEKKTYSEKLFHILEAAYEMYEDSQTLMILCIHLVLGNRVGEQYFKWYELAVEKNLRVTRLYDYYMMSIPQDFHGKIPKMVLMYFSYQSELPYEKKAFLFRYVCESAEEYPEMVYSYEEMIRQFVAEQMKAGHINKDLAFLYKKFADERMLSGELAYTFAPMLFMHLVTVDNPSITHVVILHGKVIGESIYPVEEGKVYLPIYGQEYQLLLQDAENNRYTRSIPCRVEQLMNPGELISFVSPYIEGRIGFDLFLCEMNRNYVSITAENVNRYRHLAESEQIEESYKKDIRIRLLHFYYDSDRIGDLDAYLEEIEPEKMDSEERADFTQFLISRGMFDKALKWVKTYGVEQVKIKALARLISKCIISYEYAKDTFLIDVSYYIFQNKKYDEHILTYLLMHYIGPIKVLRDIWKAADELELDTMSLMEHILTQILFSRSYIGEKADIFAKYCRHEGYDRELAYAFMTYQAYEYFVYDAVIEEHLMEMIVSRFLEYGVLNMPCELAMLKYFAQDGLPMKNMAGIIVPKLVNKFTRDEIYFPFFLNLSGYAPELERFRDKHFIEFHAEAGAKVLIRYLYENDSPDNEYITEEMKNMYAGIHVKSFTLFYGEGVQYYIIERDGEKEQVVSSATIHYEDAQNAVIQESKHGLLNAMLACRIHDDYNTLDTMIREYEKKTFVMQEMFEIM